MMEKNIKEQKKESAETMGEIMRESLYDFCKPEFDKSKYTDIDRKSPKFKKNDEDKSIADACFKGKGVQTGSRACIYGFLNYLFKHYSDKYEDISSLLSSGVITFSSDIDTYGNRVVGFQNPNAEAMYSAFYNILTNIKRKYPEFEEDLKDLYFEYEYSKKSSKESNEQDDSQLLKNDIQKEDNSKNLVEQVKKAMKNKQIIFNGAPGTGKTYSVREVVEEETDGDKTAYKFVQFHPSYDYSDFVEGLRPVVLLGQTEPTFVRMDGTFKAFCRHVVEENKANDGEDEKYYFIVDEINRGDLSKIFGELMFGLEESYRGEENAFDTQYKNLKTYRVLETADLGSTICGKEILQEDIGHAVPVENDVFEKGFYIPKNLYFVGTMNDIDRSVDSMDFALRRRFMWIEIKANEVMKPSMLDMYSDQCEEIKKKIEGISERIVKMNEAMTSSDFRNLGLTEAYHIGPAYFKKLDPQNLEESLREVFDNNVVSILREYLRGRRKDEVDKLINTCKKNLFPEEKSSGEN